MTSARPYLIINYNDDNKGGEKGRRQSTKQREKMLSICLKEVCASPKELTPSGDERETYVLNEAEDLNIHVDK